MPGTQEAWNNNQGPLLGYQNVSLLRVGMCLSHSGLYLSCPELSLTHSRCSVYAYYINIIIPTLDNAQEALNKAFKMKEWIHECLSNPVSGTQAH